MKGRNITDVLLKVLVSSKTALSDKHPSLETEKVCDLFSVSLINS